ncbi:RING-H2 finger protein ATL70 (RING-type E3 ubiquitin transferase ATL70) [Durusdinium trenchii]|uniref:RING-H2 finger protein ATL70 (RING-type E3 ubiquitin transferase ATL70) n=1 Tax=Durusdinium trenchii TaxID=1381693 RepID=A0ABP0J5C0_9DINO
MPAMFSTSRSARRWAALTVLQQMIGFLQMSTMLMSFLITLAMCFSFFLTLTWDMIFSEEIFKELIFWLYGHWEDPCDQPIGHLQQCFWIVFWIKVFILVSYAKYEEERPLDHRSLSVRLFQYLLKPLAVAFEVCWPTVTFISLRKTNAEGCSLKRLLPKPDTDLAREFRDVQFVAEVGRSVTTCSICLGDFAGDQRIVRPCRSDMHVFHRLCLSNWLRVSQSCPLCREELRVKHRDTEVS